MNTFLSILLFFIYVPFSTGILINYRYCNGTPDDIALLETGNCCPDDLFSNSCCKQFTRLAKINASYDSYVSSFSIPPLSDGLNQDFALRSALLKTGLAGSIIDHRFNFIDRNPIYLVNRVFIILVSRPSLISLQTTIFIKQIRMVINHPGIIKIQNLKS